MRTVIRAIALAPWLVVCPLVWVGCGEAPAGGSGGGSSVGGVSEGAQVVAAAPVVAPTEATVITHVDAAGAKALLSENREVVILDVRTPEEYAGGRLPGSMNLDFNQPEFREQLAKLDRDKTYLVHCAVGGRSKRSLSRFKELGFKSVVHLDGGFSGWAAAGQPVEK